MSNPLQDLKAGDTVHYWFKTKGAGKIQELAYRGVQKSAVCSTSPELIALFDGAVFERATGKALKGQELRVENSLTTIIVPKRILKPGKAKW